jgi:hypothetical protein
LDFKRITAYSKSIVTCISSFSISISVVSPYFLYRFRSPVCHTLWLLHRPQKKWRDMTPCPQMECDNNIFCLFAHHRSRYFMEWRRPLVGLTVVSQIKMRNSCRWYLVERWTARDVVNTHTFSIARTIDSLPTSISNPIHFFIWHGWYCQTLVVEGTKA